MRIILLAIALLIGPLLFAQVKNLTIESSIENVTVYTSGARIERLATVTVPQGKSEIVFSNLSYQLEQQSVQLQSDANITLFSVQATKDFLHTNKMEQQEKTYYDKIISLQDKIALDNKQLEVLKNEEQMLIKNQEIGGQAGVKTSELKQALDFQRQRFTELYQQELEIQKRINQEKYDLSNFNSQRSEISKKKDSVNYMVTALIDSKQSRSIKFHLFYTVKDASWYPTYDVHLNDLSKPLEVLMNANVSQRTGESWKDISLWLSTGNPNDNATPSELFPWLLNYYDASMPIRSNKDLGVIMGRVVDDNGNPIPGVTVQLKRSREATTSDGNGFFRLQNAKVGDMLEITSVGYNNQKVQARQGYFTISLSPSVNYLQEVVVTGYSRSNDEPLEGKAAGLQISGATSFIQPVGISTQYQPTTLLYKIDEKYTIETDNKRTTIGIKQFDIPGIYEYYCVPKTDPSAYLTANIINWQAYDLQSGEASLYFENSYLGKTYLDLSVITDTLSLSLGKDNSVKVSRKLVKEFSSKKFLGSNRNDSRQYEISVKNTRKEPIFIKINDQFPISTNKEIAIEDEKAPGGQIDKTTGIVTWTIQLAANEEKKLSIGFTVKYPKDRKVVLE